MERRLADRLANFRSVAGQIEQRWGYERETVARLTRRLGEIEAEKALLVRAVGALDRCVQLVSANGVGKIEGIVTDGLRRVFGDPRMGLVVEKRETARGNSYRLLVRRGDTVGNPMDSFGGGVQNVVGFLLRVILIKRFKLQSFIALDEQFSNVSPEFQPMVGRLLRTLADMGFTILAISHQPLITAAADNVYEVVPGDGAPPTLRRAPHGGANEVHKAAGGRVGRIHEVPPGDTA